MFKSEMDIIEDVAYEIGGKVRRNYSGRGMFGKRCYGIVCDNATACIEEAASKGLRGAKTDSMGRDYIVYWPKVAGYDEDNQDTVIEGSDNDED